MSTDPTDARDLMPEVTVYVTIGNSDDKLTQREWASFCDEVFTLINETAVEIHGQWFSAPDSPYQNACICAVVESYDVMDLRTELGELRAKFRQESVAWAEVERTEFLK
jgi:hypothetical protein